MKTYEILRMIDKNPGAMINKRFKQIAGLVSEEFGIGDIAVVTEYCGITSLGGEKFSRIRININGFEEWEEVENISKCPFCGKEDVFVATDEEIEGLNKVESSGYFAVTCDFNDGGCGATSGYRKTKEEAIEIWNRRTN